MIINQTIGSGQAQFEYLNFGLSLDWLSAVVTYPDPETLTIPVLIDRTHHAMVGV